MADHPEPTKPWFTYQSAYLGLDWYTGCTQLGSGHDERDIFPYKALVQIEGRTYRLDTDVPCKFVARRVRTPDVFDLCGE